MNCNLHHVHLFATDLDSSINFYTEMFGAEIVFDQIVAGVRKVLNRIGTGRINFYDQPPRGLGSSAVHHLGINTDDISAVVTHMKAKGFNFGHPSGTSASLNTLCWKGRIGY